MTLNHVISNHKKSAVTTCLESCSKICSSLSHFIFLSGSHSLNFLISLVFQLHILHYNSGPNTNPTELLRELLHNLLHIHAASVHHPVVGPNLTNDNVKKSRFLCNLSLLN